MAFSLLRREAMSWAHEGLLCEWVHGTEAIIVCIMSEAGMYTSAETSVWETITLSKSIAQIRESECHVTFGKKCKVFEGAVNLVCLYIKYIWWLWLGLVIQC